jgi:hypothetical protein
MLGFGQLMQEMSALKEASATSRSQPTADRASTGLHDRRMQDLAHMVRSFVRSELEKQNPQVREQQKMRTLADKSFYYLTEDEIAR